MKTMAHSYILRTTDYLLGHREDATDDGAQLREEGGEGLALLLHHDLVRTKVGVRGRGRVRAHSSYTMTCG